MHGHAHHHERNAEELHPRDLEERDIMTVYQTMTQDFTGLVGGYVTNNDQTTEEPTATQQNLGVGPAVGVHPTTTSTTTKEETTDATKQVNTTQPPQTTTHQQSIEAVKPEPTTTKTSVEQISQTTTTRDSQTAMTTSSFVTSASPTPVSSTVDNILATPSAPTTDSVSASSTALGKTPSEEMSGGAKAGIAIGAILGVGAIAALIFFLFMRRKKKSQEEYRQENEKAFGGEGLPEGYASSLPPPPPLKAQASEIPPALNVHPVTQFAPDLNGNGGINPATAGVVGAASRNPTNATPPDTPPKPVADSSDPFGDPQNPFSSALTPVTDKSPSIAGSSQGPSESTVAAAAVGTAVGAAVAAAAVSQHSNDTDSYQSAQSRGPSPTESHPSTTTPANVDGFATGGLPPPNNIHRVQLDFSPSLDDELGLRSGSLVRLVHEYDDGWALCIRLNGSQQGVAPRSCLSARPVMPRPRPAAGARGPPVKGSASHSMRPGGPMPQGRFYPSDLRAGSPGAPPHPYPNGPKPDVQFPLAQRSMSPGPYGLPGMRRPVMPINQRQRSNSAGNLPLPVSGPLAAPAPAPTGELPPLPGSVPTSMTPSGGPTSRKPLSRDA